RKQSPKGRPLKQPKGRQSDDPRAIRSQATSSWTKSTVTKLGKHNGETFMKRLYFESGTWRLISIPQRPALEPNPVPSIGLGLLAEKEHKQRRAIFDWEKHWQRWLDLYSWGWLTARESRDIESASRVAAGKAPADTFEKRALTVADRIVAAIENATLQTRLNPRFQKDNVARYKQLRKYTGTYHHDSAVRAR